MILSKNISKVVLLFASVLIVVFGIAGVLNAGELGDNVSTGGGFSNDCDPHTPGVQSGCNGGCSGGFGGGDSWWGGYTDGSGEGWCFPVFASCRSEANICGWYNMGQQDIACGGSCSATKPEDPSFNIEGKTYTVGSTCYIKDPCDSDSVLEGVTSCDGSCVVDSQTLQVCGPDGSGDDIFTQVLKPALTKLDLENIKDKLFEDDALKRVYLFAMPNIVREGTSSRLYLVTYGVDFCVVKGDNGDEFANFGLRQNKLDIISEANIDTNAAILNSNWKFNNWFTSKENDESMFSIVKSWLESLGLIQADEQAEENENEFIDPDFELVAHPSDYLVGNTNISFTPTSKLYTDTLYTIDKCYIVNHLGQIKLYEPSAENGDIIKARIKIAPKFREI